MNTDNLVDSYRYCPNLVFTMESYLYRHLKVLEDDGNILLEGLQLDHAMIARYPSYAQGNFTAEDIRYAIEETFQFKIHPQRITPYNGEYLIQAPSAVSQCLLLTRGSIPLLECNLALIPWTKEYGSTMVPLRTQLSDLGTIDFDAITWNIQNQRQQIRSDEAISIDISGIPPHLCSNKTVKTLLSYRYREIPLKTAATIEAIAIYESLRYITNVLGYKIIDLNHDTLATVVSAINNYNADIVLLQSYISAITTETEDIYEGFLQLENLFIIEPWSTTNSPADFTRLINPIIATVQHHHTAIKNIFDEFTSSKVKFIIQTQHAKPKM